MSEKLQPSGKKMPEGYNPELENKVQWLISERNKLLLSGEQKEADILQEKIDRIKNSPEYIAHQEAVDEFYGL